MSAALVANTWYRIDFALTIPASGNGMMSTWLNGTQFNNAISANYGNTAISSVQWGNLSAGGALTVWVDGIAINDSTGVNQNGVPPADSGKALILPAADSSRTGFTAGAGATTSLFDAVNNTPPVGVAVGSATNASQIKDVVSNTTDNYVATLQTPTVAGVPSGAVALVAQPVAVHRQQHRHPTHRAGSSRPAIP